MYSDLKCILMCCIALPIPAYQEQSSIATKGGIEDSIKDSIKDSILKVVIKKVDCYN